jgi:hypothetical protein
MEGDGGLTGDPLTWMITHCHCDILIMDKVDFIDLWNIQKMDISRQIVLE